MAPGDRAFEGMYRTAAEVPTEPEILCGKPVIVETRHGTIRRKIRCKPPGWWARFSLGIKIGEMWTCEDCAARWEWSDRGDSKFETEPGENHNADCWRKLRH